MVIALLALQVAGFVALYVLLRRAVMRRMSARNMVPELRSEVAALIAELNGTTERNVALLEDGIGRLQELLRSADRGAAAPGSPPDPGVGGAGGAGRADRADRPAGAAAERRAQVLRLRGLGMSSAAIADRLATSPGEVELIVNLADGVAGGGSS
jgi:DNA-binding NarL/FixJ family response regulator